MYTGLVLWKRRGNTVRKGKKRKDARPESEWETRTDESLRIIPQDLWDRVQAIRAGKKKAFPRSPKTGKLLGRPSWFDGYSDHLWSGFGQCAECSGNIRIQFRHRGRVYECAKHRERGRAICSNDIAVKQGALDDALRLALREILNPDVIALALTGAVNRLRSDHASSLDRKSVVENDLAAIQGRINRLLDAIADDALPRDEITSRVQVEMERKRALESELASLGSVGKVASLDTAAITRDLRAKVCDVSALLAEKTPGARAMLRKILVGGKIMVHPVRRGKTRGFRFEGRVSFGKLLSGEVLNVWRGVPDGQYREMDMRYWLAQAGAELRQP